MKSLNGTYSLSAEQKQFYRENEFIKLKNVLSADEIALLRDRNYRSG